MQGKIIKGIAGFYYIHVETSGIYECKAKGIFRQQKMKPLYALIRKNWRMMNIRMN